MSYFLFSYDQICQLFLDLSHLNAGDLLIVFENCTVVIAAAAVVVQPLHHFLYSTGKDHRGSYTMTGILTLESGFVMQFTPSSFTA